MKTYKKLYANLCSYYNIHLAYKKARKGKSKELYVIEFERNLEENIRNLQKELFLFTYKPKPLRGFPIRDPKTRVIHSSAFRDRIIHHAIVNIMEPIFEKIFIYDSFASRKDKGTHKAIERFEYFMRKVSRNGRLVKNSLNNNMIEGYCFKADVKHYFQEVSHEILLVIIKKKIKDGRVIWLIRKILENFDGKIAKEGMPLGNLTSQFFANVYLNELDYFVKHELRAKYYIRYVDDFVILHRSKRRLLYFQKRIEEFLNRELKLTLHPDKSKILALRNGITFLGYKIFYHYRLLIKRNLRLIYEKIKLFKKKELTSEKFAECFTGWSGYAKWANSHNLRKRLINRLHLL